MTRLNIDTDYLAATLDALMAIPSPTGYTDTIVRHVSAELTRLGLSVELTRRGAMRAVRKGAEHRGARALVSHLDTLGAQVKFLKENGRLSLVPIGTCRPASPKAQGSPSSPGPARIAERSCRSSRPGTHSMTRSTRPPSAGTTSSFVSTRWPSITRIWRNLASRSAISSPLIRTRSFSTTASSSPAIWTTRPALP